MSAVANWLLVAGAGAAGTLVRYALSGWLARATGGLFPWGTLAVNVIGCLAIGAVVGALDKGALVPPQVRMPLMIGFLGGFTTFSTFGLEAFRLAASAQWTAAAGYVLLTNLFGFGAVWVGYRAAYV